MNETRARRKVRIGRVVKHGADKTAVVAIERRSPHPVYGKIVKRTSKIYVHDENNEARVNDLVRVMETRPLSKMKRWRLVEIVRRHEEA
ncbi:MAG: 30S ribosomal protein S17 [Candidatus Eisenbacteria bacterium]|nr:30S ribosomal protein S17 [Candidatus Eisenbacteria bacterium]